MQREECLAKAKACVCGQRQNEYGTPEDNFGAIARVWGAYLNAPISPLDVAMLMALLKAVRVKTGRASADSFVDMAGYAACGYEIAGCGKEGGAGGAD